MNPFYFLSISLLHMTLLASCGLAHMGHREAVISGLKLIEPAKQMEELFGDSDHFITHYGMQDGPLTWNSEVHFGGRYSLTMQVKVQVDYEQNKVIGETEAPRFFLREIEEVSLIDGGRHLARIGMNKNFGIDEWRKVVEAQGDLSVIGIELNEQEVEHFESFVRGVRRPRDRIPKHLREDLDD